MLSMQDSPLTADPERRQEVTELLRSRCSWLGDDIYLLNLPDGLERIYFKYRLCWLYDKLAPKKATLSKSA
jgi:hypothetical protein